MKKKITDYNHIIWDWNGTLFNDVEFCAGIMNHLLISESLPTITLKKYKEIFTFPVEEYYKAAGHTFENNSFEVLGSDFMVEYEEKKFVCNLFPNAQYLLKYFADQNINQHLLSAYKQNNLEDIISDFSIKSYFKYVVGLDNIYAGGKIELGKKLINMIRSNGKNESILLIGDTDHDFEVAEVVDADCLLIADGHQSKEKLIKTDAEVLNNLSELKEILIGKEKY